MTVVNNYLPHATWDSFTDAPYGGPDAWKGTTLPVSWAVPMLPESGGTIAAGAAGDYDGHFAALARKLVADGQAHASIRLGWEMNGTWMTWNGLADPTAWTTYWRNVVRTMRAVPGAAFTFLWSPSAGVAFDSARLYPGDDVVDEVGMSVYDQSAFSSTPAQRWHDIDAGQRGTQGLAWLARFARAHHKPIAMGEWGLSARCDGQGGGDDPYFVQKMHDFFQDNHVAWEAYFDLDPDSCEKHSLTAGWFPRAAALYKKLWKPLAR